MILDICGWMDPIVIDSFSDVVWNAEEQHSPGHMHAGFR